MEGNGVSSRKERAFYWSTIALFVLTVIAFFKGADATQTIQIYAVCQMLIAGGFFGFNGLEHWSKAKAAINGAEKPKP